MKVYRRKVLLNENSSFEEFSAVFAKSVLEKWNEPLLLVREDDARILVVAVRGLVMLCHVKTTGICSVSYDPDVSEGVRTYPALTGERTAPLSNFVDPRRGVEAIRSFFEYRRMEEYVDFQRGVRDAEIVSFPTELLCHAQAERVAKVPVTPLLKADMSLALKQIHDALASREEVDFGDSIQIGSLVGGRVNPKRNEFQFSYSHESGENWRFEAPKTILEGIADGSIEQLTVTILSSKPGL
ncbi:hypothetical protein [Lacunimicrobium album]